MLRVLLRQAYLFILPAIANPFNSPTSTGWTPDIVWKGQVVDDNLICGPVTGSMGGLSGGNVAYLDHSNTSFAAVRLDDPLGPYPYVGEDMLLGCPQEEGESADAGGPSGTFFVALYSGLNNDFPFQFVSTNYWNGNEDGSGTLGMELKSLTLDVGSADSPRELKEFKAESFLDYVDSSGQFDIELGVFDINADANPLSRNSVVVESVDLSASIINDDFICGSGPECITWVYWRFRSKREHLHSSRYESTTPWGRIRLPRRPGAGLPGAR